MGTGESREHKISRVGHSLVHLHARQQLIGFPDLIDMGEIQHGIHAVAYHVHGKRDDIHISGSLTVSEQGSLHPVCTCQHTKFRIADTAAAVVVGMYAQENRIPVL